jgi:hypothetical protein
MPALIGLSPRLADHTFPRDDYELRLVARALGELSHLVESHSVRILRTDLFQTLLTDFRWDANGGLKNQIYMHLNLWFLQGKAVAVKADTGGRPYKTHPIPEGCRTQQRLEELWADELGRLLVPHDDHARSGEYFIGVACERAFAGEPIGHYEPHTCSRCFPLVGPLNCDCRQDGSILADAFVHKVPPDYSQTEVSFEAEKKNCFALGASEVRRPTRGSHYKVKFPGARSWPLDANNDPVPENYLKELEPITGHPLPTIIYALREGRLPPLRLRLETSVS